MNNVIVSLMAISTWYSMSTYPGPVYCGCGTTEELVSEGIPWVAVDVKLYEEGKIVCGDELLIQMLSDDGVEYVMKAYALDAGPFSLYRVMDYPDLRIMTDVPEHLWPFSHDIRSSRVSVKNLSELRRQVLESGLVE